MSGPVTRAQAEALLFEFTQSDALRKHARAVESVVKKLNDKAFARSVDRSYVYGGAETIGRPLEEHVGFLIETLKPIADEIGL